MVDDINLRRARAAAMLVAVCLGCGGKLPPTFYYALNVALPEPAEQSLDGTALLMPVRAAAVVRQGRIVYRESPERVGFYEYHRWAEDPEEALARAIRMGLLSRGTFASVARYDGRAEADFLLRTELRRLEEVDYGGPVRAEAEVALELVNSSTGRVEWHGAASRAEAVPVSEVASVVAHMSTAADGVVAELVSRLDAHVRASQ